MLARLGSLRMVDDFFVSPPLQETALEVLLSPAWQRHLKSVRTELRARRDALVSALSRFWPDVEIPIVPRGGLHLWVRLPDGVDDVGFAQEAALARVTVNPGRDWFPAEPTGPHLRLSYSGADRARPRRSRHHPGDSHGCRQHPSVYPAVTHWGHPS